MLRKTFLAVILFSGVFFAEASVIINELMPKNVSYLMDDKLQYSGWAELYNSGAEPVDITNYFLSDRADKPTKWRFESSTPLQDEDGDSIDGEPVVIEAGQYLLVYLDEVESFTPYHTNFKLDVEIGGLYLSDETGTIIDELKYDTTYRNMSVGRLTDGSTEIGTFAVPSPGKSNEGGKFLTKQTEKPSFSLKPGFYKEAQTIEISVKNKNAKIYYTTNGSEPTPQSTLYTEPIIIEKNTPIRAAAFVDGEISSEINTASYFINEREIDIPVVALVAEPELIYGDSFGLIVTGVNGNVEIPGYCSDPLDNTYANYYNDWKHPSNFELFDNEDKEQINLEVKIGVYGSCSRTKRIKSLKVNASKIYGGNEFDYSIFSEKPNLRWKSIVLRNSGNDFGRSFVRDGLVHTLVANSTMDVDHQAYQPSAVFINGKYYGMLNIRERAQKDNVFSNHGFNEDEIMFHGEGSHSENFLETIDYIKKHSKSTGDTLDSIQKYIYNMVDIEEMFNYFVTQIYIANSDWMPGNTRRWRPAEEGGRWRWILFGAEFSQSLYGDYKSSNRLNHAISNEPMLNAILNYPKFKEKFITKFFVHSATTFKYENVEKTLDSLIGNIENEVEFYRNYIIENELGIEADFEKDINSIKSFWKNRPRYMYRHLISKFKMDTIPMRICSNIENSAYRLNDEPIIIADYNGYFFDSLHCNVVAEEVKGYKFDHWEVTYLDGTVKKVTSKVYDTQYYAGETLKASYVKDEEYKADEKALFINEICTSNSVYVDEFREANDWIEIYNRSEKADDLGGMYISNDKNNLTLYQIPINAPEATSIDANGYKIIWMDKDSAQGPLHSNFKLNKDSIQTIFLSVMDEEKNISIIDSVTTPVLRRNESYARFAYDKEGNWRITAWTTFEELNQYGFHIDVPTVSADEATAVIYPNPVENELFFALPWENCSTVSICNITGNTLLSQSICNGDSIDLSGLKAGIYFVAIQTPEGYITAKLIKK